MEDPTAEPHNQNNLEQHLTGFAHDIRTWVQKEPELVKTQIKDK